MIRTAGAICVAMLTACVDLSRPNLVGSGGPNAAAGASAGAGAGGESQAGGNGDDGGAAGESQAGNGGAGGDH